MINQTEIIRMNIAEQQAELLLFEQELEQLKTMNLPSGNLIKRDTRRGHYYLVCRKKINGHHVATEQLIIEEHPLIENLARQKYLEKMVKIMRENISCQQKMLKSYVSPLANDVIPSLGKTYKEIIENINIETEDLCAKWEKEPYCKLDEFPNGLKHMTTKGYKVRSKSEAIIVNMLHTYGINFHYEEKATFTDEDCNYIFPDITIILPNGEKIIWEHLGLMTDYGYTSKQIKKINAFYKNGYSIGGKLILTSDDGDGNLNTLEIREIIETQILPRINNKY
ncbi:MAG: hypothetical protein RR769_01790 [Anaerovoracaceae bacterium]